jgi:hypothetical protein
MAGIKELKAKVEEDKAFGQTINATTLDTLVAELNKRGYSITKDELIQEAKLSGGQGGQTNATWFVYLGVVIHN